MPKKSNTKNSQTSSDDFFKKIYNNLTDAVFVHDLEGNFLEVNKMACQKLGYKKSELLNMSPMEIDAPEYASQVKGEIKELIKKGSAILETVHVTKKGDRIPVELNSKVVKFKEKKAIISIARDISERIKERRKAKDNNERFKELFSHVKSGVIIFEPKNKGNYFVIKDFNREAEKIEGQKKEDVVGKSALKSLSNIKKGGLYRAIKMAYRTGNSLEFPVVFKEKGKIINWRENYVFKLSTGEVVNAYRDVTKQRKEKEELKKTQGKLQKIIEFVPSAIFTTDVNYNILSWNKNAEDVTGFTEEEMIGEKCTKFSLYPCQEKCGLWAKDVKKPILNKECKLKTKAGEEKIISKNIDYLYNSRGEKIGGIESFIDITEEKKREQELKEKVEEAEKLNKIMTGRELKMIELKGEIEELKRKIADNSDKIEI